MVRVRFTQLSEWGTGVASATTDGFPAPYGQMRRNDKKSSWCLCGWAFWDLLALPGTGSQISCSIPLSRVPCKRLLTFIYLWIDIANLQSLLRKSENNYLRKLVTLYITPLPEGSWALIHEWLMMSTRSRLICIPGIYLLRTSLVLGTVPYLFNAFPSYWG